MIFNDPKVIEVAQKIKAIAESEGVETTEEQIMYFISRFVEDMRDNHNQNEIVLAIDALLNPNFKNKKAIFEIVNQTKMYGSINKVESLVNQEKVASAFRVLSYRLGEKVISSEQKKENIRKSKLSFSGFSSEKLNVVSRDLTSNEMGTLPYKELLESLPANSGYIGLGFEPNYDFMAYSKASHAWLYDINPDAVKAHLLNRVFFMKAENPLEFIAFYSPEAESLVHKVIKEHYAEDLARDLIEFYNRKQEENITVRGYIYKHYLEVFARNEKSFLTDKLVFAHTRKMFSENRVRFIHSSHLDKSLFQRIAQEANALKIKIGSYYFSNSFEPIYRCDDPALGEGIRMLPLMDETLMLTTKDGGINHFGIKKSDSPENGYVQLAERRNGMLFNWKYLAVRLKLVIDKMQ